MRKRHLPLRSVRFDEEDIEVEDAETEEERKERELEASIEERRQEILEDLQEDPEAYYRTLEPGWMDELRAWYLFYTRYFSATGYLLYQYLRFYINWAARWLWAVFRSPVGRRIMAVFVALRVAMLCAEVQCKSSDPSSSVRPFLLSVANLVSESQTPESRIGPRSAPPVPSAKTRFTPESPRTARSPIPSTPSSATSMTSSPRTPRPYSSPTRPTKPPNLRRLRLKGPP